MAGWVRWSMMISRAPCMRSAVVIRFRCGRDTGDASGSCLGNDVCAMLSSIYLTMLLVS